MPGGFLLLGHVSARFENCCRNKLQFTATKGTLCWPRFAAKTRLARPPKILTNCLRILNADLTKDEIRELSRRAGMPAWDEPASACLSSRIPYHSEVTVEKLQTIERAEAALRRLGFRVCRVRHHDDLARIELGRDEIARALEPELSATIIRALKAAGYKYVTIDLQGYRLGSLNEGLPLIPA